MDEEKKMPEAQAPEPVELGPDGLPHLKDRASTLTIVQGKDGGYYMNYPEPLWISLQLLAQAQALFANMVRQEEAAAQELMRLAAQPRIVRPDNWRFDPRYQKKQ